MPRWPAPRKIRRLSAGVSYGDKEDVAAFERVAGRLFKRMQKALGPQLDKKRFLEIMAASLAITEPNDEPAEGYYYARHKKALEAVGVLMALPEAEREAIISTILQEQNNVSWMASGNHRYMGLALAIVNLLKGRDIFDRATIDQLVAQSSEYRYLLDNSLQYGNPFGVDSEWIPSFRPQLHLDAPEVGSAGHYQWLDIGSIISGDGSPALNFLNQTPARPRPPCGGGFPWRGCLCLALHI